MITLEISSTDIRVMETAGGRITRWASRSLEPGMFEEEVIVNPQALGAAIKALMTSSGIRGKSVIASISGLYSLSRLVTVSRPGELTREAVLGAAVEVMPLSEDELYLSWQPVTTVDGGQQVLVVGVPRDILDSEVLAMKMSGIQPRLLDLKPMALARAVNREQALILNIQPSSFDMVIIVNGVIEVMHTAAWQPDKLPLEEKTEHLASAMKMTVGYYNSHRPDFPLDPTTPLFLTGQMSRDSALLESLQTRLEYYFEPLAPPLGYPQHLPVSQYAVNIGLALKGTAAAKSSGQSGNKLPDIDLLPDIYRPWKPSAKQMYLFVAVVAAILLLLPFYKLTADAMGKTAGLKVRYDGVNSALERRQAEIRNREPLQFAINEHNTIVGMGGGFTDDIKIINSLADKLGVRVQSISHSGGNIAVSVSANSSVVFRNYVTALREHGSFRSVTEPPFQFADVSGGTIVLVH